MSYVCGAKIYPLQQTCTKENWTTWDAPFLYSVTHESKVMLGNHHSKCTRLSAFKMNKFHNLLSYCRGATMPKERQVTSENHRRRFQILFDVFFDVPRIA